MEPEGTIDPWSPKELLILGARRNQRSFEQEGTIDPWSQKEL